MLSNKLRIIGGKWRGRQIVVADDAAVRPTPNRVRETVFNWLSPYLYDAVCLDAFAGSGALGFEALSRGAKSVTFIEKNKKVAAQLQKNKMTLDAVDGDIICADAITYHSFNNVKFNIVFLDPPFHQDLLQPFCASLQNKRCLADGAIIYLESKADSETCVLPENWTWLKQKQSGEVKHALLQVSAA